MQIDLPQPHPERDLYINMPHVQQVMAQVMRNVPAGKSVGGPDLDRPLPPRQVLGEEPVVFLNGQRLRWGEGYDVWDGDNPEAGELRFGFDLNFQIPAPGYRRTLQHIYEDLRYATDKPLWRRGLHACRSLRHLRREANKVEISPDVLIVYVSYS